MQLIAVQNIVISIQLLASNAWAAAGSKVLPTKIVAAIETRDFPGITLRMVTSLDEWTCELREGL